MEISSLSKLLKRLFETKTITPSYKIPHILFCIMLIGKESNGIGRYKIRNEMNLGEGSTKTLLNRLKDEKIIKVDKNRQKGHVITKIGKKIFQDVEKLITFPQELVNEENKFVVGKIAYYSIVDQEYIKKDLGPSIDQRDEAIKIGGTGATCLTFNGTDKFEFSDGLSISLPIKQKQLKKGDILIIGAGNSKGDAILATFAAANSILKI